MFYFCRIQIFDDDGKKGMDKKDDLLGKWKPRKYILPTQDLLYEVFFSFFHFTYV